MRKEYKINDRFTVVWYPKSADCVTNGKNWMLVEMIDGLLYAHGFYTTKREAVESAQ